MSTKRPVGRPRKPNPTWWPKGDASATDTIFESAGIEPNITAETTADCRAYAEENRRERVSESVRPVFDEGRKIANKKRKRVAQDNLARAIKENDALVKNAHLSISVVVKKIVNSGKTYGAGRDALRRGVAAQREKHY